MIDEKLFEIKTPRPVSMGTGLIVLDIVINGKKQSCPSFGIGGSCGNVLTILAYLGWSSYPVASIGKDLASKIILKDIREWGVKTDFIYSDETKQTPIVVERIQEENKNTHVFEFKCPYCGSALPRNRPVPLRLIFEISKKMPDVQVFYVDRVSKSALTLAKLQKQRGALIVFEPHRIYRNKLFREFFDVAHIVKYSAQQICEIPFERDVLLEIQTLGNKGLRYKLNNRKDKNNDWKTIESIDAPVIIDTAGAGDWCSAGIIHFLGRSGIESFQEASMEEVESVLKFGQRMAALNCAYEGARGLMYNFNKSYLWSTIHDVHIFKTVIEGSKEKSNIDSSLKGICSSCKKI